MLRLVRLVKRAPGIALDLFNSFRRDQLGPFVAGLQTPLNLSRYVQTHGNHESAEAERSFLALREGVDNLFDGMEEYWWPSEKACLDVLSEPGGAWRDIEQLERNWIDSTGTVAWLAVEYPQVSTSASRIVAAPKSGLFRLAFAITSLKSLEEEAAQRYWLVQHGPLIRGFAVARGTLAYHQVHRSRTGLDARLQSLGVLSDAPYMGHAEAWFTQGAALPGPDGRAAIQAALADEQTFIDWSRSSVFLGKELVFVDRNWLW